MVMTELKTAPPAAPRYEFLDTLRGVAILGVLSTHCAYFAGGDFPGKPFAFAGLYGVQLFFMVSAFTIFMTLERALERDPAIVRNFYIRRVLRILPMFWVGIVVYAFLPGREHYYEGLRLGPSYYFLTAIFMHGWHPNYINCVVPGGWTIAVEMTFYIVAPFIFFRVRNWRTAVIFFLATLVLFVVANNCLRIAYNHRLIFQHVEDELVRQYSSKWFFSQLPVFGLGIVTYYVLHALPEGFRTRRNGSLLLAASTMCFAAFVLLGDRLRVPPQFLYAFGFGLLILGLALHPVRFLVNQVMAFVGRISFSFYLMHFVIMVGVIHVCQTYLPNACARPGLAYLLYFAAILAIATPVSWLTYTFVEQPFIRLGARLAKARNQSPQNVTAMPAAPADSSN